MRSAVRNGLSEMATTASCTSYADDVEAVVPHGEVVELVELPGLQDQCQWIWDAGIVRIGRRIWIRVDGDYWLRARNWRARSRISNESCSHFTPFR